jgi:guanine deaminase
VTIKKYMERLTAEESFMTEAIIISEQNVLNGGGPFGAVVVFNGQIIGKGMNRVTDLNDPTAHAEVMAIREASKQLGKFDLSGCEIYTSCEPCPMCLGAIYWARISKIYFGNNKSDATRIGFDDQFIYDEIDKVHDDRLIPTVSLMKTQAAKAFEMWEGKMDKTRY